MPTYEHTAGNMKAPSNAIRYRNSGIECRGGEIIPSLRCGAASTPYGGDGRAHRHLFNIILAEPQLHFGGGDDQCDVFGPQK